LIGLAAGEASVRLDEVILNLSADAAAVVVGPANLLCDPLRGDADRQRAQTLRSQTLALALRLPRGLWREAHRQSLAVWICRGGAEIRAPRVADLSALGVGQLDVEDLVVDLVAALGQSDARSYRYARRGELSRMLAGGPVVPRGAHAVRWGSTTDTTHLDGVHAATLETSRPLEPLDVVVAPASMTLTLRHRSLAELQAAGHLTMRRGCRIDVSHADPAGTVVVLPDDDGARVRLDAFDAVKLYPRAYRTEPGDVVFVDPAPFLGGRPRGCTGRLTRPHPATRADRGFGALDPRQRHQPPRRCGHRVADVDRAGPPTRGDPPVGGDVGGRRSVRRRSTPSARRRHGPEEVPDRGCGCGSIDAT
jgi:hypothetical protein